MSPAERRLPVVIVGGLCEGARRAAVGDILHSVPGTVVLHHDLSSGPESSVHRTIRDNTGPVDSGHTPLVNDCACCALREDLVPELVRLADAGTYRLAVVELWDSVEPQAMAAVIAAESESLELTGVATAVDPALVLPYLSNGDDLAEAGLAAAPADQRTVADTFARQIEYPTVLALAPGDETADDADLALLAQLTPAAQRLWVGEGTLGPALTAGFDVEAAAARQHPACALLPQEADEHGVDTLVWRRERPFHPGRLHAALEDLVCAAARIRGRFWLADRPDTLLSWDAAGGALCVESAGPWLAALPDAAWEMVPAERRVAASLDWHPEHGDRCQHLTFTCPGLDRDNLLALLDSCLLTDAEYAAGPPSWRELSHAFDELLDSVA
ncbi:MULTISPECIES: GTP-binding protein [unclassified Streptomyces]|uniref:GTP-binding protein n=1 Tax=unclassified Streptomyces TaxID=2593676 RepID=UPI00087FEA72|nr:MULTISPECIES: GTP-binding protein [unclassified Streptomyces]PBC85927.1 G3E family GTPase [Streptomyces sp. 2321.6]SDR02041.1 GTPase, G3E family [Streptomyces sp. KS_16]SED83187.1 GTPase, G3E family [Streptomyces sp. 2133.1]SNC72808.1 GTPase, G3E family [Streptomyces sp. 2114.4]